jgi:hypothetical protein
MSRFTNFIFGCSAACMAMASSSIAQAQAVPTTAGARATAGSYVFDISLDSLFAGGTITTDSTGHAIGITGLVNGTDPITGLSTYAGADNDLYVTGAWVTFGGLSFSSTTLGDFNFYNSGRGSYGFITSGSNISGYADGRVATAHVAPVPEPATWGLMIGGVGLVVAALRRKRRVASAFA